MSSILSSRWGGGGGFANTIKAYSPPLPTGLCAAELTADGIHNITRGAMYQALYSILARGGCSRL